jgi:hypothetical protein
MTNDKEREGEEKRKYEHTLPVAAFLGGITLTVLTLLIPQEASKLFVGEDPFLLTAEQYKDLLIAGMGIASTLFIVSIVGLKAAYIQLGDKGKGISIDEFFALLIYVNNRDRYEDKDMLYSILLSQFSFYCFELGFVVLLISFPILVGPYFLESSFVIIAIEIIWAIIIIVFWYKVKRRKSKSQSDKKVGDNKRK